MHEKSEYLRTTGCLNRLALNKTITKQFENPITGVSYLTPSYHAQVIILFNGDCQIKPPLDLQVDNGF